jgi:hypothetical protein
MLQRSGFRMVKWKIASRSFHLSYIAERAITSHKGAGALAGAITQVIDPKLPVGWLGDITFVGARPELAVER